MPQETLGSTEEGRLAASKPRAKPSRNRKPSTPAAQPAAGKRRTRSLSSARRCLSQDDFRNLITISSASIACFDFSPPIPCSLESSGFVVSLFETPSRCLESSLTFALSCGHATVDDVIGLPLSSLLPRNLGYGDAFRRWHESRLTGQGFEASVKTAQGDQVTLQAVCYGRFEEDHLTRLWLVFRDVTPQARAVLALSQAELHYRSLVERPGLLLVRIRPDGSYDYMSKSTEELLGVTLEDVSANPAAIRNLAHPDDLDKVRQILDARVARHPAVIETEHRLRLKSGDYHWFIVRQYPKLAASGEVEYYDLLAFDVQKQREMEFKLAQYSKSALVGQLSAGVAHDLNNHLTAIRCQLEIAHSLTLDNSPAQDALRAVQRAVEDCHQMGQQLLTVGRGGSPKPASVKVPDLVAATLTLARYVIPPRITVRSHLGDPQSCIWGDPVQLQQVIMNLLLNARDAIVDRGDITVSVSRVSARGGTDSLTAGRFSAFVCIAVRDTGSGIPNDALGHIFSPFFSTKRDRGGNGLGLSMVKTIVEAQHGFISFSNEPTGGATFSVCLPLLTDAGEPLPKPASGHCTDARRSSIVVAEDADDIRHALVSCLAALGHVVTAVASGRDLAKHLLSCVPPPDLLILDEHLPDQIASESLPDIRRLQPSAKILIVSGEPTRLAEIGRSIPAIATLPKPFTLPELVLTVSRLLPRCGSEHAAEGRVLGVKGQEA